MNEREECFRAYMELLIGNPGYEKQILGWIGLCSLFNIYLEGYNIITEQSEFLT